jgi:hypothetical protein
MTCPINKLDSNIVGLRIAEESCLNELPVTPDWYPYEPNSFNAFGAKLTTIVRKAINPSRQSRKGTVTDLESTGGFQQDLTKNNSLRLLQGFFFADLREKKSTSALNAVATLLTSVTGATYIAAAGMAGFVANDIIFAEGFTNAANNGIKYGAGTSSATTLTVEGGLVESATVTFNATALTAGQTITLAGLTYTSTAGTTAAQTATAFASLADGATTGGGTGTGTYSGALTGYTTGAVVTSTSVVFTSVSTANIYDLTATGTGAKPTIVIIQGQNPLVTETPTATAKVAIVGRRLGSGTSAIALVASPTYAGQNLVRLTDSGTDFTTLGFIVGEWIYIGSDVASQKFANNSGFARIKSIAAGYLEFDKTSWSAVAETGTAKTIALFFGSILRSEDSAALIKRRSYQLERTLGSDANGVQSEYVTGAIPNELTLNVATASKVETDFGFIGMDTEYRSGLDGVKSGTRPVQSQGDPFNTSTDMTRMKISLVTPEGAFPTAMFGFATDLKLSIKNNVTPAKAIGVIGAFDANVGQFEVSGSATAYFTDLAAVQAVRDNSDVTLDFIFQQNNFAMLWDIPLLTLGVSQIAVAVDQPITIPLETMAVQSVANHTLLFQQFNYLPSSAY